MSKDAVIGAMFGVAVGALGAYQIQWENKSLTAAPTCTRVFQGTGAYQGAELPPEASMSQTRSGQHCLSTNGITIAVGKYSEDPQAQELADKVWVAVVDTVQESSAPKPVASLTP